MSSLSNFTEEEFQLAKEKIIFSQFNFLEGQEKPFAVLTGGQPGAGKTTIVWELERGYKGNIAFINGDDYRKAHPRFLEIYKDKGGDFTAATGEFSGRMVEELVDFSSKKRLNMIVEGTLRSASVPDKTRAFLQERGYSVSLAVMAVRPEVSYLSTLKRYKMMLDNGTTGRCTSKADHDFIVKQIVSNLDFLYKENKFDNILLYNRDGTVIYNRSKTPDKNPADVLYKEFNRVLSRKEKIDISKAFIGYVDKAEIVNILHLRGLTGFTSVSKSETKDKNYNTSKISLKPKPGNPADGKGGGPGGGRNDG